VVNLYDPDKSELRGGRSGYTPSMTHRLVLVSVAYNGEDIEVLI